MEQKICAAHTQAFSNTVCCPKGRMIQCEMRWEISIPNLCKAHDKNQQSFVFNPMLGHLVFIALHTAVPTERKHFYNSVALTASTSRKTAYVTREVGSVLFSLINPRDSSTHYVTCPGFMYQRQDRNLQQPHNSI